VLTWRELEVELVDGDPKLLKRLDRSLRKQGAARSASVSKLARGLGQGRPAKTAGPTAAPERLGSAPAAAEVVVAYLAAERDHLAGQDLAVRLDRPDSIHQMRVATRRLRSTLRTFGGLFADGSTAQVEAELKWLGTELGAARDAEVLRARAADDVAQEREHQPVSASVVRGIDREMARAQRETFAAVVGALDSDRYRQLVAAIDELVAAPAFTDKAARPARKVLSRPVSRSARKVEKALAAVHDLPPGPQRSAALHEVRKKAKRARYAGEALTPAFGDRAAAFAAAMEKLQDLLGEHHDSVSLQDRLEQLTRDGHADVAFTLGRLHAAEASRQAELEVDIASAAKAATKKSLRSWLG
jgi:CHAD domain-containing protein